MAKFFSYLVFTPLLLGGLVLFPFFVLVRGAIFLHEAYALNPWICIGASSLVTGVVIYLYLWGFFKFLSGAKKTPDWALWLEKRVAFLIMAAFLLFSLLYVSGDNAKTKQIQSDYGDLHPIVRVALSSVTIFDSELVITDLERTHGDYAKMGLKDVKNSLHFKQKDGYVHALDLRTNGRGEVRNQLLEFWLKAMGMRTLRHIGTADHLHTSLMIHEAPNAL